MRTLPCSRLCTHLGRDFSSDCLAFFSLSSFSFLSFRSFSFFILAFFWLSDFLGGFFAFVRRKQNSYVGKLRLKTRAGQASLVPRIPLTAAASPSQTEQGSGAGAASWTSLVGDRPHLRRSCCCYCRCRSLFCPSPSSFSPLPLSPSLVAAAAPPPPPFSGAPPALAGAPRLSSSIH